MGIWIGEMEEENACWQVLYTKQAKKDAKKLASSNLKDKAEELLAILAENPFQNPPTYEKLVGDLNGAYSRRINVQHRLVYEVIESEKIVKVIRMWTHYE
ncbi:MAG: Txe/YoeB family addiction module toxin [Cyanobacteriota bacterium]|nr:Txe/YoeB family addiction module toxin [Cyanobacteriota bacterium]